MQSLSIKDLVDSGVHFGCKTSQWNPKMKPFIYGKRNLIHIIDLEQTIKGILRAQNFLHRLCSNGQTVLFVGTKRQIRPVMEEEARRVEMSYVTERWIGGSLTNFGVIRRRLGRLEELENLESTGTMEERFSKKMASSLRREQRKIFRNLDGIRGMTQLPGAMIVVDPRRELNAVKEARRMAIPTICLLDTDCDPELADIAIPANDDAMKSVQVIVKRLADSIIEGKKAYQEAQILAQKEREAAEKAAADKAAAEKEKREKELAAVAAAAEAEKASAAPEGEPVPTEDTKEG